MLIIFFIHIALTTNMASNWYRHRLNTLFITNHHKFDFNYVCLYVLLIAKQYFRTFNHQLSSNSSNFYVILMIFIETPREPPSEHILVFL